MLRLNLSFGNYVIFQVHDIPSETIETGNDRLVVDDQPGSPLDPTGILLFFCSFNLKLEGFCQGAV